MGPPHQLVPCHLPRLLLIFDTRWFGHIPEELFQGLLTIVVYGEGSGVLAVSVTVAPPRTSETMADGTVMQ